MSKKSKQEAVVKPKSLSDVDLLEKVLTEFRIRVQTTHNAIELIASEHYGAAKLLGDRAIAELRSFENYLEDMIYEDDDESSEPNNKAPGTKELPVG